MQTREQTLNTWLTEIFPQDTFSFSPLAGDASFRKYYRLHAADQTFIIMDAPPEKEAIQPFLFVQALLMNAGIQVPHCLEKNISQGFLLLTDFGDELLLHSLTPENTDQTYKQALDVIFQLQNIPSNNHLNLPQFDETHIHHELGLFKEWFLHTYLKLSLSDQEQALLASSFIYITKQLMAQPRVFIHRDYHSRNIMRLKNNTLGIIDFQDAMVGPIGYDLVSLLKDCYIQWPKHYLTEWIHYFYQLHSANNQQNIDPITLMGFVELCGLQRHLKVLGIFSRLALRDQKVSFLQDLPLTLHYVMDYLKTNPELKDFHRFMQERVQLP